MRKVGEIVVVKPFLTVTDPGYNNDTVWKLVLPVVLGTYTCHMNYDSHINRVRSSKIVLKNCTRKHYNWKYIGEIGVDAGLAGYYSNKPNYTDEEWFALCNTIQWETPGTPTFHAGGFCTASGYGDGEYNVYGQFDPVQKAYVAISIKFIV